MFQVYTATESRVNVGRCTAAEHMTWICKIRSLPTCRILLWSWCLFVAAFIWSYPLWNICWNTVEKTN